MRRWLRPCGLSFRVWLGAMALRSERSSPRAKVCQLRGVKSVESGLEK